MKRLRLRDGRTKAAIMRSEQGSILLEAALVLPIFLLLLVFLSAFIQLATTETALQRTVDNTAKQIAAHIRPAQLLRQELDARLNAAQAASQLPLPAWSEAAAQAAGHLPMPAGQLTEAVLNGNWQPAVDWAASEAARPALEPLLRESAENTLLNKERLSLSRVQLPDLTTGENAFLLLEAEYEFPIRVPFTGEKIILRRTAMERVWMADSIPAAAGKVLGPEQGTVRITGLTPVPAKPGRKATLTAVAAPGAQVTLEVRYKSGNSVSRHVGTKTADSTGRVEWTWLVSGNTTAGIWEVIVTSSDGGTATMPFHVQKKAG
ncbi:hypothetical protein M3223_20225 [Paenibacillus pasadenensis]|uniref:hypothetical protein n=1 Tax=Paenibacillus pasadenensis TaxID=217090 RepID=UPI00203CD8BA|nr:hypothetical protein [Paenibacillus pasadenensis]MCM3749683.1 hypothetical protein [Paenibacillus pasadenensis]